MPAGHWLESVSPALRASLGQQPTANSHPPSTLWRGVAVVTLVTLACFFYAFVVADRYAIFLYEHLGAAPDAPITRSRYWMTGLVAAGVAFGFYLLQAAPARRVLPSWLSLWAWSALPVTLGIVVITRVLGRPPIAWSDTIAAVVATLAGLALSLAGATVTVQRPRRALAALPFILALVPLLVIFHVVEMVGYAPSVTRRLAWTLALGVTVFAWLAATVTVLVYRRRNIPVLPLHELLAGSLLFAYVLLPLVHFVLLTPPAYKYISAADNFFARNWALQAAIIGLAWVILWAAERSGAAVASWLAFSRKQG